MFRKKISSVVIPIIIGMCISVIPYQENMAGETSNKSVSVQSSGEPSGDAQVISEETEDLDEIELYAVGGKKILARPNLSNHCYQKLEKDTASQSDMKKTIMIAVHLS